MATRENLIYNSEHDYVEGYEDVGDKRTEKVTIIYKIIIIKSIVPIFRLLIIFLLFVRRLGRKQMEAASILLSCKEFHE